LGPFTDPVWSPDGTKIVIGGPLKTMNPDGSGITPVGPPRTELFTSDPDWQPIVNQPPDCSTVAASRPVLGTVNRRLVPLTLDGATDPDGDAVTHSIDGITQDEPVRGRGDATSPDATDEGDGEVGIRAERSPHGDGRVYQIAFTVTDGRGASCSGTAAVGVPRHKKKAAVDSAPPSYDSFGR
jgi:hypothetical protein